MRATPDGLPDRPLYSPRIAGCLRSHMTRLWIVLMPVILAGCQADVLDPKGSVAAANKTILLDSLAIMLAIVIPTIVATLSFAWWYRAENTKAKYLPNFVYSGRVELITWSIPLLTIILLGGVAWIGSHELDPAKPLSSPTPALEVQGVSMDWKWLFIYPEQHIATVNQLVVPAGVPLHFALTSASVMNTFFVPQLGSMIYTMNGMSTQLNLIADQPGTFRGRSAHFSGDGFSDMHFNVKAVPTNEFTAWVTSTRGNGSVLDTASYAELSKQSIAVDPFTYRDAEPELFQKIVTQQLPPAPGPRADKPGANVSPRTEH